MGLYNSTGLCPGFETNYGYNPGKSAGTSDPIDIVVSKKALVAGTLAPVGGKNAQYSMNGILLCNEYSFAPFALLSLCVICGFSASPRIIICVDL